MADEKIFEYHPANVVPLYFEEGEPPVAIDVLYNILTSSKDYGTKYTLETIPLHLATDQFIAYMAALKAFDMDIASDFIQIGTTLLKIKSEALLRVPIEEEPEEEDLYDEEAPQGNSGNPPAAAWASASSISPSFCLATNSVKSLTLALQPCLFRKASSISSDVFFNSSCNSFEPAISL